MPVGGTMTMDGKAIWNFATEVLPSTVRELCEMAGVSIDEIKLLVPHQANRNILSASAEKLGLPFDRVAVNIERYGNTLAGSIPIALDEALADGRAKPGDLVALVGFGAGLAWGGLLFNCKKEGSMGFSTIASRVGFIDRLNAFRERFGVKGAIFKSIDVVLHKVFRRLHPYRRVAGP